MNLPLRRILQVALPLVVILGGLAVKNLLAGLRQEPSVTPPQVFVPLVTTETAQPNRIQLMVHAQGVVRPRTETTLVSEVQARVLELSPHFRDGGFFETGELLARLDDTDLRVALEDAHSNVASTDLMLAQEEADADLARRDWHSVHGDDPMPPLVARLPQLARAEANRAAAQAARDKAQRDVDRCRILAPYPGRVFERMVERGTYVTVGRELAKVYAIDFAEARLPVPDQDLAALDLSLLGADDGPQPKVTLEAEFAGTMHRWKGRILRTTGAIDPMSRMVVLVAEVADPYGLEGTVQEGDRAPLFAGMFVEAWIEGRTLDGAVAIPRQALQSDNQVYVLTEEGRLEFRDVDVAHAEVDRVILRAGLAAGDRVITSPLETPIKGMRLRQSPATQANQGSDQ